MIRQEEKKCPECPFIEERLFFSKKKDFLLSYTIELTELSRQGGMRVEVVDLRNNMVAAD
jgi:hypothetical protein